jgi:hypothetical protein
MTVPAYETQYLQRYSRDWFCSTYIKQITCQLMGMYE